MGEESSLQNPIVRREMPELDTLRGIAVLMVVFYHGFGYLIGPYGLRSYTGISKYFLAATWTGWMGVNLFFVLSGFLITGILLDSKNRANYFGRFYFRRALRILPAYYLILLLLPLLSLIPHYPRHVGLPFVGLAFVYCANLVDFFNVQLQYGPLWSLAVEEHFYLLWPAVVRRLSPRMLLRVALIVIAASPALRLWSPGAFGVTWQNLDGLSMGAILAVVAREATRSKLRLMAVSCLTGAVASLAIGIPFGIHLSSAWTGKAFKTSITDLFFLGVLLTFLLVGTSSFAGFVNIRPLKFFGYISYGMYLVHMTAFDVYDYAHGPLLLTFKALAIRFAFAFSATVIFCWVMRVTFEEYFLQMKDRNPFRRVREPRVQAAKA